MKSSITVKVEFKIADVVYIKTDPDQMPHIVTAIVLKEKDTLYQVTQYSEANVFYGYELSYEPYALSNYESGSKEDDMDLE